MYLVRSSSADFKTPMVCKTVVVHATREFSGAARSIAELLSRITKDSSYSVVIACPPGSASRFFRIKGFRVVNISTPAQFNHTAHGYYHGTRWLLLCRELIRLLPTAIILRRLMRDEQPEIVHFNEITLAPLRYVLPRQRKPGTVIHVRSRVHNRRGSMRYLIFNKIIERFDIVIPIDQIVASTLRPRQNFVSIHNTFKPDLRENHVRVPFSEQFFTVGFVGNLLLQKGILDLVEAVGMAVKHESRIRLLIIGGDHKQLGSVRRKLIAMLGFPVGIKIAVEKRIRQLHIENIVHLAGPVENITGYYKRMNVLCFPSHLNAPGRPVIEAASVGVPSIVAVQVPTRDTVIPEVTGVVIPAKNPNILCREIIRLSQDVKFTAMLGQSARLLYQKHYDPEKNAAKLASVYHKICSKRATCTLTAQIKHNTNKI